MVEVGGVGLYAVGKPGVGLLPLIEGLDDLNAADVLHDGAVHGLGGLDGALVLLAVVGHYRHHEGHAHRDGHQAQQGHPPVQYEQVDKDAYRTQHIGGHLRQQVGQGPLHALHLVYDDLLHLATGGIQDGAERHSGEFLQNLLPDGLQNGEGSLVGDRQGQGIQAGPQQEPCQGHGAPGQVEREFLSAGQQAENDLGGGEVRSHAAQHPCYGGEDGPDQAAVLCLAQLPQPEHGTLLVHLEFLLIWLGFANSL